MEASQGRFQEFLEELSQELPEKLDEQIAEILKARHLTVATAESITGGLVAYRLTTQPGSSEFFTGGVVCYSTRSKIQQLGIPPKVVVGKGVVSEEVAVGMAQGVRLKFGTQFGLSTTGFAGPAVSETERVGLVYVAVSSEERTTAHQFLFDGTREDIRQKTAEAVLGLMYFELKGAVN
jgi:PncC family amidohydrolase